MITFLDEQDVEYGAQVEFKNTNGVNGERSISGTIYTNEDVLNRIDKGWRLRFNNEYYVIIYSQPVDLGNVIEVEFDAVHQFFYDFKKSIVHQELNGSNTFAAYIRFIFQDSGYEYRIEGQVNAIEKQSFGFKDRLTLFNDIIKSSGAEFQVNGRVVRIMPRVGTDLSTIVKKNFNLNELKIEKNINDFVTYKKGYGAWFDEEDHSKGRLEVEYASPLMSIYGKIEGEPIIDERYTNAESLKKKLKDEVENSYSISVSIDFEDLTKAGYQYDQPVAGDYIMAINDDLQFREKIRIVSFESHYDVAGNLINHKVTCNDIGSVKKREADYAHMSKTIESQQETQNKALEIANLALVSANGKNKNYYGTEMPVDKPKGTLIVGDTLFLRVGDRVKRYYWNGSDWIVDPFDEDINYVKNQLTEVFNQFDTERTETEQAIATALTEAKSEAERLDEERQTIIDGKFEVVNQAQSTLEQSIAEAEQNAQDALTKAGASEDLAKIAKEASDNVLTQFDTTRKELSEAKATAEETLKNAINALSGANSVITQSQMLLDNAESAKAEATNALIEAQRQLEASGVISGNLTAFKNEVNNAIKGYVTQATYDSNNQTLNTRLNEWEKTADGIKTSISEVEGKVDNLQIGTRNLIINSIRPNHSANETRILDYDVNTPFGLENIFKYSRGTSNSHLVRIPNAFDKELYDGRYLTFSIYAKTVVDGTTANLMMDISDISPTAVHTVTDTWKQYSVTVLIDKEQPYNFIDLALQTPNVEVYMSFWQLEVGTIASDWKLAEEDKVTQSEYSVYKNETEETVKGFTRTVSAYEQDVTGYKNQVATFNQSVDGYKSEVAKQTSTVNGLTTEVANYKQAVDSYSSKLQEYTDSNGNLTAKVNSYEATVDGYNQSLTRVEGKIDNLQVGGRNLLKGTTNEWTQIVRPEGDYFWVQGTDVKLEVGETYTFSVIVEKVSNDNVPINLHIGLGRTPNDYNYDIIPWRENNIPFGQKIIMTQKIDETHTNGGERTYFAWRLRNEQLATTIRFKEAKLEKGNKATDWTPAPEDFVSQSEYTTYQNQVKSTTDEHTRRLTALDGDGGRMSKVEQTASQIQTSLSSYAKTAYVDTQITNKAGEITTNLTKLIPTDTVSKTEFQAIKETTNLYERTIGTTETDIKSNIAKITMTDSLFQTEIRNASLSSGVNLYDHTKMRKLVSSEIVVTPDLVSVPSHSVAQSIRYVTPPEYFTDGEWYTLSFDMESKSGNPFWIDVSEVKWGEYMKPPGSGVKQHYSVTFQFKKYSEITYGFIDFNLNSGASFKLSRIMINRGKVEAPYIEPTFGLVSKVTQLSNSWALTLKSGNDVKTAINATTDGIRLKGSLITLDGLVQMTSSFIVPEGNIGNLSAKKITSGTIDSARINSTDIVTKGLTSNVVKSEHILANEALFTKLFTNDLATQKLATKQAWIKSSMIGDAQIGTAHIGSIDASEGKIINFNANYITAGQAELITAGFNGLNSRTNVDGTGINITNTDGEFISLNNNAELRSRSSDGNYIVLGNGRLQVYNPTQNQGYFGVALSDADGSKKMGVYMPQGSSGFQIARSMQAEAIEGKYYTVESSVVSGGWSGIVDRIVALGLHPNYNSSNTSQARWIEFSNYLKNLNGWIGTTPSLKVGSQVMITKTVKPTTDTVWRHYVKFDTDSNGQPQSYFYEGVQIYKGMTFQQGTLWIKSTARFNNESDRRVKTNIKASTVDALDEIKQLDFVQFDKKADGSHQDVGLIAQDSGKFRVQGEETEAIDVMRLIYTSAKAIQELGRKVKELEEQNETLRTNSRRISN